MSRRSGEARRVFLASDHAGFELKEKIEQWLKEWGYDFEDLGPHKYDAEDDYPLLIKPAAEAVAKDPENQRGIVIGGSGQGEAIVCNREKGVFATVYAAKKLDLELVMWMREHNNSNVLSLGARRVSEEDAKKVVKTWLDTPFGGGRHARRIAQIDA